MSSLRNGEVHANSTTVDLLIIHGLFGSLCVLQMFKVDEGKASGTTSLSIQDDGDFLKRSELGELFLQLSLCGVQTQTEDSQTGRHCRFFTVSDVTTSVRHR